MVWIQNTKNTRTPKCEQKYLVCWSSDGVPKICPVCGLTKKAVWPCNDTTPVIRDHLKPSAPSHLTSKISSWQETNMTHSNRSGKEEPGAQWSASIPESFYRNAFNHIKFSTVFFPVQTFLYRLISLMFKPLWLHCRSTLRTTPEWRS